MQSTLVLGGKKRTYFHVSDQVYVKTPSGYIIGTIEEIKNIDNINYYTMYTHGKIFKIPEKYIIEKVGGQFYVHS